MESEISNFAKTAINGSSKIEEISKTIGEHLHVKYGNEWKCVCTSGGKLGLFVEGEKENDSIQLQIGNIRIFVFK